MRYALIIVAAMIEGTVFSQLTIARVVPAITLICLLMVRQGSSWQEKTLMGLIAGFILDTLRAGYAPLWTIVFLAMIGLVSLIDARISSVKQAAVINLRTILGIQALFVIVGLIPFGWHQPFLSVYWVSYVLLSILVNSILIYIIFRLETIGLARRWRLR